MQEERNPISRSGDRNVLCPLYRECLDQAVREAWADWDCSECAYRLTEDIRSDGQFTLSNPVDFYELPLEIEA